MAKTAAQKAADKKAKEAADLAAGNPEAAPEAVLPPANEEADALEKEIEKETAAPEGVPTGKTGIVSDNPQVLEDKKTGVKTIKPTGKFVSIGNLIFNEFGQHCGTEADDSTAARKAGSFNTHRKFR